MNIPATPNPKNLTDNDGPFVNDLDYIQAELLWVEARAKRIAAQLALKRIEEDGGSDRPPRPRHPFADEPEDSPKVLHRRAKRALKQERRFRKVLDRRLAEHRASDAEPLALDTLTESCGLDAFERDVVLLALGPFFSRKYQRIYGGMCGHDLYEGLSVEVVFEFAELSLTERIERRGTFGAKAPLVNEDLVLVSSGHRYCGGKDLLDFDIGMPNRTFAFLVGRRELEDEFLEFSSLEQPRSHLDQVVLNERDKRRILSVVERHDAYLATRKAWGFDDLITYGRGTLMLFSGPSGTGKTMTAHGVAAHLGKRILNVDIPTFLDHSDAGRFLPGLFREARLQNALLFFDECEALFASRRRSANQLMTLLLTELERFEGVAVLATNLPEELDEALLRRALVRVTFPKPDRAQRAAIWTRHLPDSAPVAEDVDVDRLAERFELTGGLIKNAVLAAVAASVHENAGEKTRLTMRHFEEAAEGQLPRQDAEGRPVKVPAERLGDLVLSTQATRDVRQVLSAVRNRAMIRQVWGVGGNARSEETGVAALLQGPPGTGKTLCAHALAGELGRPLLLGRAPALLSKWVGESERNLETLFTTGKASRAVILLDEADGLLTSRQTDARSRHDLSLVNTLLDLIERYPGLVLLATNLPDRLDIALERRLGYRIEFGRPARAQREQLWARMLPATAPTEGPIDHAALGRHELTGALIQQAVMRAATRVAENGGVITQSALEDAAVQARGLERKRRTVGFG